MIAHKHISKIIAVIMALVVCLCFTAVAFSSQITAKAGESGISMEYEKALFNKDNVINVNILMGKADWNNMLENAILEEYYQCDVEVNGTTFYRVAIRPKGNTSLTSIANDPTTNRYSFKLEFDHYVDGQTCFGLDKLILNNNYADATNMKEALIYDMYRYLGADASLYNYAKISVNGEYWGVYIALEAVEDSFLLRNYGVKNGKLYKPDSMNIGGGGFGMGDMDFGNMTPPNMSSDGNGFSLSDFSGQLPGGFSPSQKSSNFPSDSDKRPDTGFDFAGGMGGFSMGGNGANLNYSDDNLDSYSTIWDGEVTKTKKSDHKRVVTALKNISEGNDLESYMDIDNLLRYMAVHIFSVNEDSLSSIMAHNYYLYESGGKLNIIPWDYNLSLGGMGSNNDATSVVNDAIDNAFSGTKFFDTLMDNETYHSQYYDYLQQLVDNYINGGAFDAFYQRVRNQIDTLVEADPNAFYDYDEYLAAVDTLYKVVKLRGESIEGQLSGLIPSTSAEQRDSNELIDASAIDLSVMGSMSTGGGNFGPNNKSSGSEENNKRDNNNTESSSEPTTPSRENGNMPSNFDPSQFGGQLPEGFDPSQFGENNDTNDNRPPNGNFPSGGSNSSSKTAMTQNVALYGLTLLVMVVAMLFAVLYHRRPTRR